MYVVVCGDARQDSKRIVTIYAAVLTDIFTTMTLFVGSLDTALAKTQSRIAKQKDTLMICDTQNVDGALTLAIENQEFVQIVVLNTDLQTQGVRNIRSFSQMPSPHILVLAVREMLSIGRSTDESTDESTAGGTSNDSTGPPKPRSESGATQGTYGGAGSGTPPRAFRTEIAAREGDYGDYGDYGDDGDDDGAQTAQGNGSAPRLAQDNPSSRPTVTRVFSAQTQMTRVTSPTHMTPCPCASAIRHTADDHDRFMQAIYRDSQQRAIQRSNAQGDAQGDVQGGAQSDATGRTFFDQHSDAPFHGITVTSADSSHTTYHVHPAHRAHHHDHDHHSIHPLRRPLSRIVRKVDCPGCDAGLSVFEHVCPNS